MLAFEYNPQAALYAPCIFIEVGMPDRGHVMDPTVYFEDGILETAERWEALDHKLKTLKGWERGLFGRGQIIRTRWDGGRRRFLAGSDSIGDGAAYPV